MRVLIKCTYPKQFKVYSLITASNNNHLNATFLTKIMTSSSEISDILFKQGYMFIFF